MLPGMKQTSTKTYIGRNQVALISSTYFYNLLSYEQNVTLHSTPVKFVPILSISLLFTIG